MKVETLIRTSWCFNTICLCTEAGCNSFDFTALNKSKSEADAIKKQSEALAKDYDHLLQNQKKLQVISSKHFTV